MREQDTPGYDHLREAERLVDLAGDLMRRAEELVGRRDDFEAFVGDHPELEELGYFDPDEEDALAAIDAQVKADFARRAFRIRYRFGSAVSSVVESVFPKGRYRVRLVDWLDGALLPIG
jgi:hypothetical protein